MDVDNLLQAGLASFERGDYAAAERAALAAMQGQPNNADLHNLLGAAYRNLGKIDKAIASFTAAIALDPHHPSYFNNLGACYMSRGEHIAAELCIERALAVQPEFPDALNNLGLVQIETRRYAEAKAILETAISLAPEHLSALCNLGQACDELGDEEGALSRYDQAIVVDPNCIPALLGRAMVLSKLNRSNEALGQIDDILRLAPPQAALILQKKGIILSAEGRLDEACAAFDQAIALEPNAIELLYSRSQIRKVKADEPFFTHIARFANHIEQLQGDAKAQLCYALGKVWQDIGDYEKAARSYAEGALARRQAMPEYDESQDELICKALMATLTPKLLSALKGIGVTSERPIFILGMPRSGTTLVEQIIGSHPAVYAAGELSLVNEVLGSLDIVVRPEDACLPDYVANVRKVLQLAAECYLLGMQKLEPTNEKRVTDKMPGNYLYLAFIAIMFPQAKIIHCRRDPIDTCLSCYTTLFRVGQSWSYDLANVGRQFRRYWELMEHWRKLLPGRFLEVRYEDIVRNQEVESRRLLEWCNLPWDPRVLNFYQTKRSVRTASVTQIRQPIYTSSQGRWKKWVPYISPLLNQIGDLEAVYWEEVGQTL